MKTIKLGSLITISKGKKHTVSEVPSPQSVRMLGIDDLRNDTLIRMTDDKDGVLACVDDVLIAWDGANAGTIGYGKQGYIGSTISRLRLHDPSKFYALFVGMYLRSNFSYLRKTATGATIPHINRDALERIPVPVFAYDDQIRIATLLSKVENLISRRREQLKQLDELLKSVFLEMFGDPIRMKTQLHFPFSNYIEFLTSGSRGWAKYYSNSGSVFLRINNVKDACLKLDDIVYVNVPNSAEANRTRVKAGDLLLSITADLGRTALVSKELEGAYINQHLALIRIHPDKGLNSLFLTWYFTMPYGNAFIKKKNREGVKAGLNFDDIRGLQIVKPAIQLQKQFADIAEKVEGIKSRYQQSLTEVENLYGILNQKAFKGELDLSKVLLVSCLVSSLQ